MSEAENADCRNNPGGCGYWREAARMREAERDAALAELAELREELAGVKNVSTETVKAMKRLAMYARTSGGTAGPDAGLMDACEQAEKMLSLGGIGRAFMEGADAMISASAEPPIVKYDDVLLPFLSLMRTELHANSGKGDRPGWLSMDNKTALLEIFYHLGKLQKSVKNGDAAGIKEYAADVANMSMMLVDINGLLEPASGGDVEAPNA